MTASTSMQSSAHSRARTLGELKSIPDFDARTVSRSVKAEMRQNLFVGDFAVDRLAVRIHQHSRHTQHVAPRAALIHLLDRMAD